MAKNSPGPIKVVNIEQFKKMYFYALIAISRREQKINRLNVFPVPDGDTGSNVLNTVAGGWEQIKDKEFETIAELSAAFAKGTLLGARGNSGVISSQVYKGLSVGLKDAGKEITPKELQGAFQSAKEYAYNSVSNPVEGTILSVVNEVAKEAKNYEFDDFVKLLEGAYLVADHAVKNTPNQMQILKDAGVVDSGAYSLLRAFHGFRKAISNDEYSISDLKLEKTQEKAQNNIAKAAPTVSVAGYCTEFILSIREDVKLTKEQVTKDLSKLGNSIVVVLDEDILKIHVHTKTPGEALNYGQKFGEFGKIKVDNMDIQVHDEAILKEKPTKNGVIAITTGHGYFAEYRELGVKNLIDGGQGSNPSTADILEKIESANSNNLIIMPNNSNIILAANQAVKEYDGEKIVKVIPTKSSGQGIVASYLFDSEEDDFDSLYEEMNEIFEGSVVAQISPAIKDTEMNGVTVKNGDFISIYNKEIISSNSNKFEVTKGMIDKLVSDGCEIISMFYGKDISRDEVKEIMDYVEGLGTDVEIVIKDGGQDVFVWELVGEK